MVQMESSVFRMATAMEALKESFDEERKQRRKQEEALLKHEGDDSTKFASIDNRLMGTQTQLTTINDILTRIERSVTSGHADHESRLQTLEDDATGRTAVGRWLRSAWVQIGIGASIGGTLVGAYTVLS